MQRKEQPKENEPAEDGEKQASENAPEDKPSEIAENMETTSEAGSKAQKEAAEGTETGSMSGQIRQPETDDIFEKQADTAISRPAPRARKSEAAVLTLESRGTVETEDAREDAIWHGTGSVMPMNAFPWEIRCWHVS